MDVYGTYNILELMDVYGTYNILELQYFFVHGT